MSGTSEARAAAKEHLREVGATIPSASGKQPASEPQTQTPEADQGAAGGEEGATQTPQTEAKAPAQNNESLVKVTLDDGKVIEVEESFAQELMARGMRIGDDDALKSFIDLDRFVRDNPNAGNAFARIAQDPSLADKFLEQYGGPKEPAPDGNADPKDERIVELERQLAAAKGGDTKDPTKQVNDQIDGLTKRFPALRAIPTDTLRSSVIGRMAQGQSIQQAVAAEAAIWAQHGTSDEDAKRKKAEAGTRLRGAGGTTGGSGVTGNAPAAKYSASDMRKGKVKRSLRDFLNNRQT
jgi:hypothetical protein